METSFHECLKSVEQKCNWLVGNPFVSTLWTKCWGNNSSRKSCISVTHMITCCTWIRSHHSRKPACGWQFNQDPCPITWRNMYSNVDIEDMWTFENTKKLFKKNQEISAVLDPSCNRFHGCQDHSPTIWGHKDITKNLMKNRGNPDNEEEQDLWPLTVVARTLRATMQGCKNPAPDSCIHQ